MLCRRKSSPSNRRVLEACTLRRRPSTLDQVPVWRLPNSASACVPSLSSSSSGGVYDRDFLRLVIPLGTESGSRSAVFDDDDRVDWGGRSSCGAETEKERLDEAVPGGGSGLRIFLRGDAVLATVRVGLRTAQSTVDLRVQLGLRIVDAFAGTTLTSAYRRFRFGLSRRRRTR